MEPLEAGDPERIGPYSILGLLGSGGMGKVYLGRSTGGRTVAVKQVRPELADDRSFRVRFHNEVESAKAVSGAFTAAVVDADTDARIPWFASAYIAGVSLTDAIEKHGPLPEPTLRTLAAGLAEAVAAIHRTGVIHRDFKPSNVLLALDGPYVIDFGITRATEGGAALTSTGTVMGSPGFMSPEQASGHRVGPESDIFSLGATLVYAAGGRSPFGDGPTPALLYRVVSTEPDLSAVPASLRDMVQATLAKDPMQRPTPQQIIDFLDANAPAPTAGGWLPDAYTGEIIAANAVMTGTAMPQGPYVGPGQMPTQQATPQYGNSIPPQGAWQGTPPQGNYAMAGAPPYGGPGGPGQYSGGPGYQGGPPGQGVGKSGGMSRRTLIALLGGGAVVVGGAGAAIAMSGGGSNKPNTPPHTPQALGTTSGAPAPTGSSASSATSTGAPANVSDPTGAPSTGTIAGSQATTAWTSQTSDQIWGSAFANDTLVLVGTDKTHGLDSANKQKWPDVVCGSGTIGIATAVAGSTVYCSGLDGTGNDPVFAIDMGTGKVLWTATAPTSDWQLDGVAGVNGNQVIVPASLNVQGNGVMSVDSTTRKVLWNQVGAWIGAVTAPPSGNYIYTGSATAGNDNSNTITAMDITKGGAKAWHYDQPLATFGQDGGANTFCVTKGMVFVGGQKLTALDANTGAVKWQTPVGSDSGSLANWPFTDGQGRIFVTADGYVACVNAADGKVFWQVQSTNQFSIDGGSAYADGTVYVADYKGVLYALDATTGATKWVYTNALIAGSSPTTLTAGGRKVYYTSGQAVICINSNGK